jgi:hypothetical protein
MSDSTYWNIIYTLFYDYIYPIISNLKQPKLPNFTIPVFEHLNWYPTRICEGNSKKGDNYDNDYNDDNCVP